MSGNFVWAIRADNGKPEICRAKPENVGKYRCNHIAHQKPGQTKQEFLKEYGVKSIFEEEEIETVPYRMTDSEKEDLKEINSKKDLREDFDTAGYIHLDEPVWNDMDKNYFAEKYGFDRKLIDKVLHEECRVIKYECYDVIPNKDENGKIIENEDGTVSVSYNHTGSNWRPLSKYEEENTPENTPGVVTGLEGMNAIAAEKGFSATTDVYVLPYHMRPGLRNADGEDIDSDTTKLYLALLNRRKFSGKSRQKAYEDLVNGSGEARKGYALKPLSDRLRGKSGIWRKNITAFTIPYAGRAVITPNIDISYDETTIPVSMAADIFKPTITKNMSEHGFSQEEIQDVIRDAKSRAGQASPFTGRLIQRALDEENVRVLLNRNPSLHEASLESFRPSVDMRTNTIGLNPLVCSGYGADFDGDAMAAYGLNSRSISKKADEEMHPSNYKMTPRDRSSLNFEPTKDAKWGIFNVLKQRTN